MIEEYKIILNGVCKGGRSRNLLRIIFKYGNKRIEK